GLTPLFFHSPLHHPHLHSFPTRRSSDLPAERPSTALGHQSAASGRTRIDTDTLVAVYADANARARESRLRARGCGAALLDGTDRSEEHTSELQSRGHLVCRLLLEKKKKK